MRRMMMSVACAMASLLMRSTGGRRNGSPMLTLTWRMERGLRKIQGQRTFSVPVTETGRMGAPVRSAMMAVPGWPRPRPPVRLRVPSGNMISMAPLLTTSVAARSAERSASPRRTGKAPKARKAGPRMGQLIISRFAM
ncbi:MAG: hypothetical protein A2148_04940 [Chloroflexi bacterium RBG_16_68_14]|nr:MAG: hypothetical protein A2148_04940 [Chloroflexi bacterium RBG_16_68_14]